MTNQIVILAAGKGKRMGGDIPKVLVGLKNKPLILHLLHELEKVTQLVKPVVVVGFEAEKVKAVLGNDYLYAYQTEQLGTGHAVMSARGKVTAENILVLYGDMPFITAESLKSLIKLHRDSQATVSMLTTKPDDFSGKLASLYSYGRIIRDAAGNVVKITELKDASEEEKKITEVNPGIYMFKTDWLWDNLTKIKNQNAQGEYYLTDIVEVAIAQGQTIHSLPVDPKEVIGVNSQEDLERAESI
jgi:bifunctional UDP-N-acetylglucosamine pyrophosphorylase/glucosamine-1-phosphate N-acetyltransferase